MFTRSAALFQWYGARPLGIGGGTRSRSCERGTAYDCLPSNRLQGLQVRAAIVPSSSHTSNGRIWGSPAVPDSGASNPTRTGHDSQVQRPGDWIAGRRSDG